MKYECICPDPPRGSWSRWRRIFIGGRRLQKCDFNFPESGNGVEIVMYHCVSWDSKGIVNGVYILHLRPGFLGIHGRHLVAPLAANIQKTSPNVIFWKSMIWPHFGYPGRQNREIPCLGESKNLKNIAKKLFSQKNIFFLRGKDNANTSFAA